MTMQETHIQQILELERQKLAIQIAATEVWIDDKVRASEGRIIEAVTGAITNAVVELKGDIMDVRSELKAEMVRLEHKIDNHLN
ncbi:hypothetical protein ACQP2T_09225 [Nonomuraea sp. CA-143628]|uniref:hypothetical protein n=1 Tax=Nonomuraea sp. CA-143628 TaxID=3239997 RepID=UPI003D935F27